MKKDPHIGQFFSAEEEPCPSLEEMQSYAAGKLPSVERHAFERHLLNCELCSFAYEGLAGEDPVEVEASVAAITEEAWNRVGEREKRKRRGVYMWMSGAAAILLLIVVGYFVTDGTSNKDHLQGLADAMLEESSEMTDTPARSEGFDANGDEDNKDGVVEYADGSSPLNDQEGRPEFRNDGFKDLESNDMISGEPMEVLDELEAEEIPMEEEVVVERPLQTSKNDMGPPTGNSGWYGTATTPAKDAPGKKDNSGFLAGDANTVSTVTIADAVPANSTKSSVTPIAPKIEQQGNIANNGLTIAADSMSAFTYSSTNVSPSINQPLNDQNELFAMDKEQEKKRDLDDGDFGGGEIGFAGTDDYDDDFAEEESDEAFDLDEIVVSPDPSDQPELLEKTVVSGDEISGRRFETIDNTVGGITTGATNEEGDFAVAGSTPVKIRDRSSNDNRKNAKGKAKSSVQTRSLEMSDSKAEEDYRAQKSNYQQGVEQFQSKQYREAAANLRQAAADTPDNLNAHLLAAKSFLQLKQPNAAIYHLDRILATPNNSLEEDAKWYKSIALLQLGNKSDAEVLLKDVQAKGGNRSKAAKKALDKF